jgi:hypothetical protein
MNSRMIKAIFIAPLSVFPLMTVFAWSLGWAAPLFGFIAVAFAYVGMLVIGIPSMLLLRRYEATRWWQLTLAGAIGSVCVGFLGGDKPLSSASISAAGFGALVAGVAWFIAFRSMSKQEEEFE